MDIHIIKLELTDNISSHLPLVERRPPAMEAGRGGAPPSAREAGSAGEAAGDGGREGRRGPPAREAGRGGDAVGDGGREGRRGPPTREAGSDDDAREAGSGGAASRVEDEGGERERETRGTGATRFQRIRKGSAWYQG